MNKIISFLVFHIFIFTTTQSLLSAASGTIHDSGGTKLLRGIPYYILPLLRSSGGGLTLTRNTKDACPLNVTQESFEVNYGSPFTFTPIVLDEEIIRGAYPVSIEADVTNPCHGSNIWKVTTAAAAKDDDNDELLTNNKDKKKKEDDKGVPVHSVTTGGEFNKPESCFQIVEDDVMPGLRSYQIQHCPFKCGSQSTDLACYNVGIVRDADGKGYLGRTDAIYPVVFMNCLGTFSQSVKISRLSAE
ncbi:hypothetical protein LXL04_022090 [Taraxacum kok-saghyz]